MTAEFRTQPRHRPPATWRMLVAVATAALLGGCLDLKPPEACSVTVAPATLSLPINGTAALVGTAFDCAGNSIRNRRLNYSSSNSAVATVTAEGQVIGVGVGSATVSAVTSGKTGSAAVTVTPEVAASVTVTPGPVTLRRTNTRQLTATARNAQGVVITGRAFQWASSNSAVASVDQAGLVTAVAAGQAEITAESNQTVGRATVTVTEIPIGSCALAPASVRLTVGEGVQPVLTLRDTAARVLPATGRPIVWSSDNETVATVSASGLVATRRAGTARIRAASAEYPAVTCETAVTAVDPRIAQVVITPRTGALRVGIPRGFSVTLLDSVQGAIPPGRVVTWSTPTPTVASVTAAGIVTGLALGTARLVATAEGVADTVTLAVTRIPVGGVTVTPLQATVYENQQQAFRATVTDSVGTEVTDRAVEWTSSDPARASVSAAGVARGLASGTVTIGATVEGRTGTAQLVVLPTPVDTIVVADTAFTVVRGLTTAFAITLRDSTGATLRGRAVLVTSDFPNIADGVANAASDRVDVRGLAVGTARFSLQVVDANGRNQGKVSRVRITVVLPPAVSAPAPSRASPPPP
ncbi:MAG: hypothetical protein RLZ32_1476 [Gemmatimonadota bacterium]